MAAMLVYSDFKVGIGCEIVTCLCAHHTHADKLQSDAWREQSAYQVRQIRHDFFALSNFENMLMFAFKTIREN
jgi:hypothetical protein